MTINESTKEALDQAVDLKVPFIAAFIENGIATTFSSGVNLEEVLKAFSHGLIQVLLKTVEDREEDVGEAEYIAMITMIADYIKDEAVDIIYDTLSFSNTAN